MKEKINDFFNGIFAYDRPGLRMEPAELIRDERRIKGFVHTRIPGMVLRGDGFFARAVRVEYTYQPQCLKEGERTEGRIWLETSAGEYTLPVKVQIKGREAEEEPEEELPILLAGEKELPVYRMGNGRQRSLWPGSRSYWNRSVRKP